MSCRARSSRDVPRVVCGRFRGVRVAHPLRFGDRMGQRGRIVHGRGLPVLAASPEQFDRDSGWKRTFTPRPASFWRMLDWLMNRSTHQPPMSRPLMIVPCGRVTIILFQSRPSRACRVYGGCGGSRSTCSAMDYACRVPSRPSVGRRACSLLSFFRPKYWASVPVGWSWSAVGFEAGPAAAPAAGREDGP